MSTERASPDALSPASCITCGDVAVELLVVELPTDGGGMARDAWCRADDHSHELVAIDLVSGVAVGDRLLVHAGTALEIVRPAGTDQSAKKG